MIGDMCLSLIEADSLERGGIGMYAVKSKEGMTYTFYRTFDDVVYVSGLTEDQAQGILNMLVEVIE